MSALADAGPSRQSIVLGVASAAALASALWVVWPRKPKASQDALRRSLQHLRAEYAAVYAEVSASVARAGLPSHSTTSLASLAAVAASSSGQSSREEDGLQKLTQVLEQPLLLEAALREASGHAASELLPGATATDLESTLQHFENDSNVRKSVEDIQEMHQACLSGRLAASTEVMTSKEMWSEESILDMLRVLGQDKCAQLEVLKTCLNHREEPGAIVDLGARIVEACAEAEDRTWENQFGSDSKMRRCLFRLALESYSMESSFACRRAALESELEEAVAAVCADLMAGLLP
jgi:hypothetical protein